MRTMPWRGVSRSAESMMIWQSIEPRPLAGEIVSHGSSVVAIQLSLDAMRIVRVPPSAPMAMFWLSRPNSTALSWSEQAIEPIAARPIAIYFMVFISN